MIEKSFRLIRQWSRERSLAFLAFRPRVVAQFPARNSKLVFTEGRRNNDSLARTVSHTIALLAAHQVIDGANNQNSLQP